MGWWRGLLHPHSQSEAGVYTPHLRVTGQEGRGGGARFERGCKITCKLVTLLVKLCAPSVPPERPPRTYRIVHSIGLELSFQNHLQWRSETNVGPNGDGFTDACMFMVTARWW